MIRIGPARWSYKDWADIVYRTREIGGQVTTYIVVLLWSPARRRSLPRGYASACSRILNSSFRSGPGFRASTFRPDRR